MCFVQELKLPLIPSAPRKRRQGRQGLLPRQRMSWWHVPSVSASSGGWDDDDGAGWAVARAGGSDEMIRRDPSRESSACAPAGPEQPRGEVRAPRHECLGTALARWVRGLLPLRTTRTGSRRIG